MLKNVLLAIAGATFLIIVIHSWFIRETSPSVLMVSAILVLVLAPFASRIKVFELFDFQKSIERLDGEIVQTNKEVATVNQHIAGITADLRNIVNASQRQTQINLTVDSVRAAREAVEHFSQTSVSETSRHRQFEDQETKGSLISRSFWTRAQAVSRINFALDEARVYLLVTYVASETLARTNAVKPSDVLDLELTQLIVHFRQKGNFLPDPTISQDREHMDILDQLEELQGMKKEIWNDTLEISSSKEKLLDKGQSGLSKDFTEELSSKLSKISAYLAGNSLAVPMMFGLLLKIVAETDGTSSLLESDSKED